MSPCGNPTPFRHSLISKQPGDTNTIPVFRGGTDWSTSNPFLLFANRSIMANDMLEEIWGGTSQKSYLSLIKEGHRKKHILFPVVTFGASVAIWPQPENEAAIQDGRTERWWQCYSTPSTVKPALPLGDNIFPKYLSLFEYEILILVTIHWAKFWAVFFFF